MAIIGRPRRNQSESQNQQRRKRARPRSEPCVYRSEQITGTVGCKSCGGRNVQREAFWCAKLAQNVLTHPYRTDMQACSKCSDYVARTD